MKITLCLYSSTYNYHHHHHTHTQARPEQSPRVVLIKSANQRADTYFAAGVLDGGRMYECVSRQNTRDLRRERRYNMAPDAAMTWRAAGVCKTL